MANYAALEIYLLQHYVREDAARELTFRELYGYRKNNTMNLDRISLKAGDLFVTEGGHLLSFVRKRHDGYFVFTIMDPHTIEGLPYPAGARWCFKSNGDFLWETREGNADVVAPLYIKRKWTAKDQELRNKREQDAFEDVRPLKLDEKMHIPLGPHL